MATRDDLQHFVNLLPPDDGADLIVYVERLREIVQTLAGWHAQGLDISTVWEEFTAAQMATDDGINALAERAYEALGGDDGI